MILTQENGAAARQPRSAEQQFRVAKGDFVGVVEGDENRYKFLVRDRRREHPTIYGCGVDFSEAVTAVTQLMDALTTQT